MVKDNRDGSPRNLLCEVSAPRVATAPLRDSWQVAEGIHIACTKPKPSITRRWALVYVHRSAGAKTLLYTPLLEPMLSLQNPHPPETPPTTSLLSLRGEPQRHRHAPVQEPTAAGKENVGLTGELTRGGPGLLHLLPRPTFPSNM